MKHRSSVRLLAVRPFVVRPLACATLSLALGLTAIVAPTLVHAQDTSMTSNAGSSNASGSNAAAAPTPDASGLDSTGTVGAAGMTDSSAATPAPTPDTSSMTSTTTDSTTADSTAVDSTNTIASTSTTTTSTTTTTTATNQSNGGATSMTSVPMAASPMASMDATETDVPEIAPANPDQVARATGFIAQAISIAERNPEALISVVRQSASLIPRTGTTWREGLTSRWLNLVQNPNVPRNVRLDAYAAFFDAATQVNRSYARRVALQVPDAAGRVGALLALSQDNGANWTRSVNYVDMARRAASRESDPQQKARALTFIAVRLASLNPETRETAAYSAWTQVNRLPSSRSRDYLLAELTGAAAQFDMPLAGRIAGGIGNASLKNLAQARINMAELSQTLITGSSTDRVATLAKAAVRYDVRAVPILIQLPPQADVLKALSDSLPPIYPSARPAIDVNLLERMWDYSGKAQPSVQRDELQSRLARLMVTQDIWRGRTWGKSLAWKGGRIQVGAFIKAVLQSRRAQVHAMSLQDVAKRNVDVAIRQAQTLPPVARAEALLLIAGQLLETSTS